MVLSSTAYPYMNKGKKKGFLSRLLSLVFVPKCAGCGEILSGEEQVLCRFCRMKYDMLCHRKCRYCGCDICECDCTKDGVASQGVWRISKLCAYLPSEKASPIKGMLYGFKHNNREDVCEFFAQELARKIEKKITEHIDEYTICYVPRSYASYKKYGYDHMEKLAHKLSLALGIPTESLFCRAKTAKVQKELGRAGRFENTQRSICLKDEYRSDGNALTGKRFILVDDVCVTGASLGRCASLLISEGAREVRSFVIGVRP